MKELIALTLCRELFLAELSQFIFITITLGIEDKELRENDPCCAVNHDAYLFEFAHRTII